MVRITAEQHRIIVDSVREVLGTEVEIRLFGSRTDDLKRGGDIDLYIETQEFDPDIQNKSTEIYALICKKAGDILPIDLVLKGIESDLISIHLEGKNGIVL